MYIIIIIVYISIAILQLHMAKDNTYINTMLLDISLYICMSIGAIYRLMSNNQVHIS